MRKLYILILAAIIAISNNAISQEDVLYPQGKSKFERAGAAKIVESDDSWFALGIEPGLNINMYSEEIAWANPTFAPTIYDSYESGNGLGIHLGIIADIKLNEKFGLNLRFAYDNRTVGNSEDGFTYSKDLTRIVPMNLEWEASPEYSNFTISLRYNISENLFLTIGPTFDYFIGGEIEFTPTVKEIGTTLNDVSFMPDMTGIFSNTITYKYDIEDYDLYDINTLQKVNDIQENFRIGIDLGISYDYKLNENISIVPTARIQYFTTPAFLDESVFYLDYTSMEYYLVAQHQDRMLHSIQLGIGFWYHF